MDEIIKKLIERLEEYQENNTKCKSSDDYELGLFNACEYAIEIVNELAEEYINTSTDSSTDLVDASTDTSSGWVACSERLPEEDGNYLVQQDDGRINILHYCKGWNCTYMDIDKTRWSNACERKNIIAWQPLPAPYKEGE